MWMWMELHGYCHGNLSAGVQSSGYNPITVSAELHLKNCCSCYTLLHCLTQQPGTSEWFSQSVMLKCQPKSQSVHVTNAACLSILSYVHERFFLILYHHLYLYMFMYSSQAGAFCAMLSAKKNNLSEHFPSWQKLPHPFLESLHTNQGNATITHKDKLTNKETKDCMKKEWDQDSHAAAVPSNRHQCLQ